MIMKRKTFTVYENHTAYKAIKVGIYYTIDGIYPD